MGHFSEYMILGFFSFSYLSNIFMKVNSHRNYKKTAILSQIFSGLYASSDEFHQTFVVGRDGNVIDVLIDSCIFLKKVIKYLFREIKVKIL